MTYDNFIFVHSMTFDLEECVQTVYRYGLHRTTAEKLNKKVHNKKIENLSFYKRKAYIANQYDI